MPKNEQLKDIELSADAVSPPPKRRRLSRVAAVCLGVCLLAGVGAGGTFLAEAAGIIHLPFREKDPNRPKLVARDGSGFALQADEQAADASRHKASYYPIGKDFTSNLSQSESFVQLGLGVSTYYDERVFENLQRHEMAVRSAVLMTLSEQDPAELASPTGKLALQSDLKKAINEVLRTKEGFGGIDGVYFTSFVMQ